jgi:maleate isomerase
MAGAETTRPGADRVPLAARRVDVRFDEARRTPGIGVIAPFDFALDAELWAWTPEGVSVYVTRMPRVAPPVGLQMAEELRDHEAIAEATDELLATDPGVVVYACNSASYVHGVAGERRLRDVVLASGAPRALTASGAMLEALRAVSARRVSVGTPYDAPLTSRLAAFLAEDGHEVVGASNLGLHERIAWVSDHTVSELVRAAYRPETDVVVVSCTNLPTSGVLVALEEELDRPILSANLVTMWAALRTIGVAAAVDRPERLFKLTR